MTPLNSFNALSKAFASRIGPLPSRRTSSTKKVHLMYESLDMLNPFNVPSDFNWRRYLLNPSTIRRNRRGEMGHPCLRPVNCKICTKDKSNHQAQTLVQLEDTSHYHLGGRPPHFRPAILWPKGRLPNKTTKFKSIICKS